MRKFTITQCLPFVLLVAVIAIAVFCPEQAHATTAGGTGLPWETPIQRMVDSFLGPVAMGMILIGFVGGVWGFMTGGEINGFVRSMVVMLLSGSILLAAKPFVQSLFGVGALLG
jgi:type IV secretory pathway VirB2 component (pilin)